MKYGKIKALLAGAIAAASLFAIPLVSTAAQDITYSDAVATAQAKYPKAKLTQLELDREKGRYVYDMEFVDTNRKEYDVKVDVQTGKIIRNKYEGKLHSTLKLNQIKTSYDEAIATAQKELPKATFDSLDIEWRTKMPYYEIDFKQGKTERTIVVDAATGEVVKEDENFITSDEAEKIAIDAAGGGTVIRCKLDAEDSKYDVDVRVSGGVCEVEIDAVTGDVIDIDWDD